MRKFLLFALLVSAINAAEDNKDLVANHDMLEISKNFQRTYQVHKMFGDSRRTLGRLNNIDFSMKPLTSPIKPFDTIKTHYAYPLKIFLPAGATVTSAKIKNSAVAPVFSQNVITVETSEDFESGLLDIIYIQGFNTSAASYISIKLDAYVSDVVGANERLYTQVEYYEPKKLQNSEIIAALSADKYNNEHTQITYMGITYDIFLVSIVKDSKVISQLKDNKYINAAVMHGGQLYNYYVK
ncbi:MAG: hypothetical protein PHO62_07740 [Sulfurimonas sp.]|uniref:hypothetical protein n=1 Tax=Sulfurimonas sp. TaxID=2022749 RepID=UPI0026303C2C|nr:hypothetical protein [Sulfurimonas sp.]MDD5373298.1 hypothetical protein [Sulfurimonas sp.]